MSRSGLGRLFLSLVLLASGLTLACGDGSGGADAGSFDAGSSSGDASVDAGAPDSGTLSTPCGEVTCAPEQYCHVDANGPCLPSGAGSCAAGEEACLADGQPGCTANKTRQCRVLPAACSPGAACSCLIGENLCPELIVAQCRKPATSGATVECPDR